VVQVGFFCLESPIYIYISTLAIQSGNFTIPDDGKFSNQLMSLIGKYIYILFKFNLMLQLFNTCWGLSKQKKPTCTTYFVFTNLKNI
jgi:hypothetical protein